MTFVESAKSLVGNKPINHCTIKGWLIGFECSSIVVVMINDCRNSFARGVTQSAAARTRTLKERRLRRLRKLRFPRGAVQQSVAEVSEVASSGKTPEAGDDRSVETKDLSACTAEPRKRK